MPKHPLFALNVLHTHISDKGRIIHLGSSTTAFPMPGHALYGGSKMAPRFLVEVLAKEIGHRGVTVNSILPTATAAEFPAGDLASFVSGQHLLISGGGPA